MLGLTSVAVMALVGQVMLRGDISVERGDWHKARVWLILEDENRGLGISISLRVTSDAEKSEVCVETRYGFLLWRSNGTARSGKSLECYERAKSEFREVPLGKRLLKFFSRSLRPSLLPGISEHKSSCPAHLVGVVLGTLGRVGSLE